MTDPIIVARMAVADDRAHRPHMGLDDGQPGWPGEVDLLRETAWRIADLADQRVVERSGQRLGIEYNFVQPPQLDRVMARLIFGRIEQDFDPPEIPGQGIENFILEAI